MATDPGGAMRLNSKWTFDRGRSGFLYEEDAFRFTSEPDYAKGSHNQKGGREGGGLSVTLGGVDDAEAKGMSAGWTKAFKIEEDQRVTLTFRVKMVQGEDYLSNEYTEVRAALDGGTLGRDGDPYLLRIYGDGEEGGRNGTGWRKFTLDLGVLEAGRHELTLGGFGNRKSAKTSSKISFDEIELQGALVERNVKLGKFEAEVLERTNAFREKHGLDPVEAEANLMASAEDWSREMAKGDFFRHSDLPGQITDHGYDPNGYGENIAAGYPTAKAVVNGWIDSPGHRKNMLREDFEDIGIGHYYVKNDGGAAPYGHYWTQIFGDPSSDYFG